MSIGVAFRLASGATLTLNADGSYVYNGDTITGIENQPFGTPVTDSFTYTAKDGHGDTNTGTVHITVNVPAEPVGTTATKLTGTVDEDGLPGGIAVGDGGTVAMTMASPGSVAGLFTSGADDPLHYSFKLAGAPVLTSGGVTLVYTVATDTTTHIETLTAKAGATTVFTLTLDETSGATAFTLLSNLDHPTGNGENTLT